MLPAWLPLLLVSPIVGSFLGVLVMRLPEGRPVALARSACDGCGTPLGARDLVPLLSFVALRGRCRYCRAPINRLHPAIELAAALVAGLVILVERVRASPWPVPDGATVAWLWSGGVLGWGALALALIDWRCLRLPDVLTLPLLLLGLGACFVLAPDALGGHAAAVVVGYGAFRGLAWTYRRLRGRDGLGAGDAKLLAAGGAWLGLGALPILVLCAALATLGLAVLQGRGRIDPAMPIPFGPGLAVAVWGLWLWSAPLPLAISG
jgi:leader peptidase (prepilin peptidase)/N-methyltransferase